MTTRAYHGPATSAFLSLSRFRVGDIDMHGLTSRHEAMSAAQRLYCCTYPCPDTGLMFDGRRYKTSETTFFCVLFLFPFPFLLCHSFLTSHLFFFFSFVLVIVKTEGRLTSGVGAEVTQHSAAMREGKKGLFREGGLRGDGVRWESRTCWLFPPKKESCSNCKRRPDQSVRVGRRDIRSARARPGASLFLGTSVL